MSRHDDPQIPQIPLKEADAEEYAPSDMGAEATRLMREAKRGDGAAFDVLVRRLRPRAFRVAHALVGSREDALELSQEAFLKVYRARETFRDDEPFLPWFHRILRNTCFSFLRRRGRIRRISLSAERGPGGGEDDWELVDADAPEVSAGLEAEEQVRTLRAAFRRLSARDREILTLRHFQELSYREIAEALNIPQGTVMSRLFHARRRLREALEHEGYDEGIELETSAARGSSDARGR